MKADEVATGSPDPTTGDLEIEITEERVADGVAVSFLYFTSHRIDGDPVRIYGIYARPVQAEGLLPGILFIHGGGQTAEEPEVIGWARQGYAAFSHDWNPTEERGQDRRPNRWPFDEDGRRKKAVPPELDEALWINRRALTLLERQPQVDPDRLGVCGFSWGGHHTWNITANDPRVKAAIPSCGRMPRNAEDHLLAPVLFTNASEDFFGRMDALQTRTSDLRIEFRRLVSPNENHNLAGVPWERTRQVWFDHYLRGGPAPAPSPMLAESEPPRVTVLAPTAISAELLYSYGESGSGDRCWFSLPLHPEAEGRFSGRMPLHPGVALWYFANCTYPDGTLFSTEYSVVEAQEEASPPLDPAGFLYDPATDGRNPWYFSWRGPVARHPWRSCEGTDLEVEETAGRPGLQVVWRGEVERPEGDWFRAFLRSPACPVRASRGAAGLTLEVIGPRPLQGTVTLHEHGIWNQDQNPFQAQVILDSGEGWATVVIPMRDFRRRNPTDQNPEEAPVSLDRVRQIHLLLESPERGPVPVAVGEIRWIR